MATRADQEEVVDFFIFEYFIFKGSQSFNALRWKDFLRRKFEVLNILFEFKKRLGFYFGFRLMESGIEVFESIFDGFSRFSWVDEYGGRGSIGVHKVNI